MTKAEWLACDDPERMLNARGRSSSFRKLLLFGVGCCRRVERYFRTDAGRRAIELAERLAEGPVPADEVRDEVRAALDGLRDGSLRRPWHFLHLEHIYSSDRRAEAASTAVMILLPETRGWLVQPIARASGAAREARGVFAVRHAPRRVREEQAAQAALLREVLGNPFRPVAVDPRWLTSTAVSLASAIYAERAFDRLPILADALEDAGCDQPDLLAHCRSDGPHVRGCWAVDLILGKS